MINRRTTITILFLATLAGVVCLQAVYAAPPQFRTHLDYSRRLLSPFPEFDDRFIASITPEKYIPLRRLQPRTLYDYEYDYPRYSITYTRKIKREQTMVPVNSPFDAFVNRRIETQLDSLSNTVNRASLIKEQRDKAGGLFSIRIPIPSRTFESIFGEGGAGLRVSGYRRISFTGRSSWNDKPQTGYTRQSKFPQLQMEQDYRFDIEGTIGSKISVKVSQDSRNDIPLANRLILRYKGTEDDVLQSVEAGNTTLNLPSTQFLAYSTRVQGLFGIKATAQLADLSITAIASQEKGSTETVEINPSSSTAAASRIIKDINYADRVRFDLGRLPLIRARSVDTTIPPPDKYDFIPEGIFPGFDTDSRPDSIRRLVVFVDDNSGDLQERFNRIEGRCFIDPEDTLSDDPDGLYRTTGYFEVLEADIDYYVEPTQYFVQFLRSFIGIDDIVAVYMEVERRRNGSTYVDTIGDISASPHRLKLIKPHAYLDVNNHIWEYEWRNIYSIGQRDIDVRNVEVNIYKGAPLGNTQRNPDDKEVNEEGIPYIQILGLDQGNEDLNPPPDGRIDRYVRIDPVQGLLIFPSRHPFDSRRHFMRIDENSQPVYPPDTVTGRPLYLSDSVPEIYNSQDAMNRSESSKYYLAVALSEQGSSQIDLRASNIIEGSEVITNKVTGKRLARGTDYNIDYDLGVITLLTENVNINSDLSITFERAPFFSLSRKTLLGTRLEYAPNRSFNVGTTLLYKSEKSTNRKPKVGEETSKMLVWDADLDFGFKNPLFTTFANAIPFITATSESHMKISAEVAQSRPNPNVDGEVFIDDFEGSKNSYQLGIQRKIWQHTSRPVGIDTAFSERGHVAWYNPLDPIPITEIWNRDIGTGETQTANILKVHFKPVAYKFIKDTVDSVIDSTSVMVDPEKTWAGFVRYFSPGAASQLEKSQFLEIRMRGEFSGNMHIDLGRISEDVDGDGELDAESRDPGRALDPAEDVGLDGLSDPLEFGYDPDNGVYDPAGDNFDGDLDNPANIWRINGTEGNADKDNGDPDGGYLPDSEDPEFDVLDEANSYFSYEIYLNDTLNSKSFYVPGTQNENRWKTIRIPLRDPEAVDTLVGDPSWSNIFYARIWFDSATTIGMPDQGYVLEFASIELLSTTWADSFFVADSLFSGDAKFEIAVINNEVDSLRYNPPPGVEGYYDPQLQKTENEQSLLLMYENLNAQMDVYSPDNGVIIAADTGLAVRRFINPMNFMGYGKLEAYVWGGDDATTSDDSVLFFFRLGYDKDAYYEYRTVLKPGWDERNHVLIDFAEITALKARLQEDRKKGIDSSQVRDSGNYRVKVKGFGQDPTLTRIRHFAMGVVNLDPDKKASGEVWVDELRLTDVRNDVGLAGRFSLNGNMSDLLTYNFSYSTQDAYYRGISSTTKGGAANNLGSGQTRTSYSFGTTIKLDKFFPRSLELSLPLRISWQQSVQEPLLRSGTDITVPDDLKDQETSVTVNRGFGISERINKKTKNPLFTLLLNRFTSSFDYRISKGHSATQPMFFNEGYTARGSFDMSVRTPPSIQPLFWMRYLKVIPFGLPGTRLYLYPNRLSVDGNLAGSYSSSFNQTSANPVTQKLDFRGSMNSSFKIFDNLNGSYNFSTDRDLRDPNTVNITLNPKDFKLGVERNYNQNLSLNYTPALFNFLTHRFGYAARYGDTYRTTGQENEFVHSVSVNISTDVSFTFNHTKIIGTNKASSNRPRPGTRQTGNEEDGKEVDSGSGFSPLDIFGLALRGIRSVSSSIKPVSGKVGRGQAQSMRGLADKATFAYRFGLTDDPGVERIQTTGGGIVRQQKALSKTFSANSGVSLFAGIGLDVGYSRNTRETFSAQPLKTIAESWPDLNLDLRSVQGLWYLGKLLNTLSPTSRFSRSKDTKLHTNAVSPYEIREQRSFSPLISFSLNPLRSMRTTFRYERSSSETVQYYEDTGEINRITRQTSQGVTVNWSYQFRNPSGIKLPLLGRLKFESNLSVSVDVSIRKSRDESASSTEDVYEFKVTQDKTNFSVRPTASYSFSSTVKGGLSARWQDDHDEYRRETRHTRELGLWVELRF